MRHDRRRQTRVRSRCSRRARLAHQGTRRVVSLNTTLDSYASIGLQAHYEYFSEQSQLLRDAFSGALPANLARPSFATPTCRGGAPRAIASAPDDLRLWLPLPDPVSFPYVVHFIYFGDFDLILRILCARPSHVMGLWKNALYLKLEELVHWMKIQIFDEEDDIIEEENEDAPSGPPSPTATGTDEETSDVEMSGP